MKAIVIGATGAVGKDLVEELLSRGEYEKIITFTRRPLDIKSEKIESYIIDFDRPSDWAHLVKGDVLFSALGTSLKQAGSKEAQYRIDHDYQLSFAKAARENGVPHVVLVSSLGANRSSSIFYLKLKGLIERDVEALQFPQLSILRPPSLIRKHAKRPAETVSVKLFQLANALGLFKTMAPVPTESVARKMADLGLETKKGLEILTGQETRG
jgi:uncharacterized protein YbjT (DUF2867 family)